MSDISTAFSSGNDAAAIDARACALCNDGISRDEMRTANQQPLCTRCANQLATDLAAEKNIAARLPMALAGGTLGALVAAGIWAAIVVFTNYEIGFVALLVGFLAGQGVKLGAGKGRGKPLQIAAAALAVFGLLVAKYFIFAHFFAEGLAEEGIIAGPFDPSIIATFPVALPELLSPFDLLWTALALSTAWKVPAASKVTLQS